MAEGAQVEVVAVQAPAVAASVVAIVLNWRQPAMALRACGDLLACGHPGLRVFLRDNGSGDGSAAALAQGIRQLDADGQRVYLDAGADNLGFAGGVNCGLAWARAQDIEQVLLVNNDVRVPAGAVGPLSDLLRCDADVGAVGPTILRPDGRVWAQGGSLGMRPNVVRLRGQGQSPAPMDAGPEAVDFLPGAFVMFRTVDLAALGGLEESYFLYWEDVDVALSLKAIGKSSVWLPWVRVEHDAGGSSGGGRSRLRKYMQAANSFRFVRRHGRPRWRLALGVDCALAPLSMLIRPRTGWAKVRGLWFGLRGGRLTARDVGPWLDRPGPT